MIREALSFFADLVKHGEEPVLVDQPRVDRKVYLIRGKEEVIYLQPPVRSHSVYTLDDFVGAVKLWGKKTGVVFHAPDRVELVCEDCDRYDRVTLPLSNCMTEVALLMFGLGENDSPPMSQRDFLRLLRVNLRTAIPDVARIINAVQTIETVSTGHGRSEISPGRERGTSEFSRELVSDAVPELVNVYFPMYRLAGLNEPMKITCSLEVTLPPHPVTFRLCPLGDQMAEAVDKIQGVLHGLLVDALECLMSDGDGDGEPVPVLFGKV